MTSIFKMQAHVKVCNIFQSGRLSDSLPGDHLTRILPGLAWALIIGITVSTFFTLVVVPVVHYMAYGEEKKSSIRS
jgi:hypothetical protein